MRPALLVDLDCDLYTSSAQALQFVLDAGLLVPGSYVYLDDIMPWVWADRSGAPALEQKLAFQQATARYGLTWQEVPLNATRRDYVYVRPVLMLVACAKCTARAEMRERRGRAPNAASGHGDAPPSCLVPASERERRRSSGDDLRLRV